MAIIKITFDHPEASAPKHKFGERVALTDKCQPKDWLTGKVVGLTLEDTYEHRWWYAIKLDYPLGLTEEYLGHDLVTEQEIPMLQAQWETGEAVWVQESHSLRNEQKPSPEFQPGELVKFSKETGCNLMGDLAQVVSSRYVSSDDWSGWVYQLTNEHLTQSLEIGERWLELASPVAVTSKRPVSQEAQNAKHFVASRTNPNYWEKDRAVSAAAQSSATAQTPTPSTASRTHHL